MAGATRDAADVVVIGGGIVGVALAYELIRKHGADVRLLERDGIASGTTSASAAHVPIQTMPPGHGLTRALRSRVRFAELSDELQHDIEFVTCGGTVIATDEVEERLVRRYAELQSEHVPVELVDGADLRAHEPALSRDVVAGAFCELDAYVNPMQTCLGFVRAIRRLRSPASVRLHMPVRRILTSGGAVSGVEAGDGSVIAAPVVVVAAGVWSAPLVADLGVRLPVTPRKGELLVSEPVEPLVRTVISHAGLAPYAALGIDSGGYHGEYRYLKQVAAGGFRGRFYIGATQEDVGFDRSSTAAGIRDLAQFALSTVPALREVPVLRTWAGLRPAVRDGRPYVGSAGTVDGLFLATGHGSLGILDSVTSGELLARLIADGDEDPLLEPWRPEGRLTGVPA